MSSIHVNYTWFFLFFYTERISATSCDNINITTNLNQSSNTKSTIFNTTSYVYHFKQLLHDKCKDLGSISVIGHRLNNKSLSISFKFTTSGEITTGNVDNAITICRTNIEKELNQNRTVLLPKLTSSPEERQLIGNMTRQFESCCDTQSKYCCPAGSLVRSTGGSLKNVACCKLVTKVS